MLSEFKKFILRGNLVDLAIGFTVGAAFSTVARSLVDDIIMPPIGLVLGNTDFSNLFWVIKSADAGSTFNTIAEARQAGAVTLNYGLFVNNILTLLVVALAMFAIIKAVNYLESQIDVKNDSTDKKDAVPSHKKCPFCLEMVAFAASRCPHCTSQLKTK